MLLIVPSPEEPLVPAVPEEPLVPDVPDEPEVPRWDSDKGGYVYGNDEQNTESFGGGKAAVPYSDPQANSEPDEDLPF